MQIENFEVYKYLRTLQDYFLGDLREFDKLCLTIEQEEMESAPDFNLGSMFHPGVYDEYHQNKATNLSDCYFRLTIPITISIFSVAELMGLLISKNKISETEQNFFSFFNIATKQVSTDDIKFLNRVFRQGLTHVYFPKLSFGVKYHSTNPKDMLFFKNKDGIIFLNVNQLKDIIIQTTQKIIDDHSLYPSMEIKYKELLRTYELQLGNDIKRLLKLV